MHNPHRTLSMAAAAMNSSPPGTLSLSLTRPSHGPFTLVITPASATLLLTLVTSTSFLTLRRSDFTCSFFFSPFHLYCTSFLRLLILTADSRLIELVSLYFPAVQSLLDILLPPLSLFFFFLFLLVRDLVRVPPEGLGNYAHEGTDVMAPLLSVLRRRLSRN